MKKLLPLPARLFAAGRLLAAGRDLLGFAIPGAEFGLALLFLGELGGIGGEALRRLLLGVQALRRVIDRRAFLEIGEKAGVLRRPIVAAGGQGDAGAAKKHEPDRARFLHLQNSL